MSGDFSDHAETLLLRFLFTADDLAAERPTQWYAALFSTAPSDAGGGTEIDGPGYARQVATFTVTGALAANDTPIEFTATGVWDDVTHGALFDAPTGGVLLAWKVLPAAYPMENGRKLVFEAGAFTGSLD